MAVLNYDYFSRIRSRQSYLDLEAATLGKRIEWGDKASVTKNTLTLRKPSIMEDLDIWEYELEHEVAHEAPENASPHWFDVGQKHKVKHDSTMGTIWNYLDDHVAEHNRLGRYAGRDEVLKRGRVKFTQARLAPNMLKGAKEHGDDKDAMATVATAVYDMQQRVKWNPALANEASILDSQVRAASPMVGEMLDKLKAAKLNFTVKDCDDTYDLTLEIMKLLDIEDDGTGKGGDGSEGTAPDMQGVPGMPHTANEDGDEQEMGAARPQGKDDEDGQPSGMTPPHDELTNNLDIRPVEEIIMQDYPPSSEIEAAYAHTGNLDQQTLALLQIRTQTKWEGGQKRGRLNSGAFPRVMTGNNAIFKKRADTIDLNAAVYVLCDGSGSMHWEKYDIAAGASGALAGAILPLGVALELAVFQDYGRNPRHRIIIPFNDRPDVHQVLGRLSDVSDGWGSNDDGASVLHAADKLLQRKEKRKIMIVLSDGHPASSSSGSDSGLLTQVVQDIEQHTPIELFAFGIQSDAVEKFYTNYRILSNATELEHALTDFVRDSLIGG